MAPTASSHLMFVTLMQDDSSPGHKGLLNSEIRSHAAKFSYRVKPTKHRISIASKSKKTVPGSAKWRLHQPSRVNKNREVAEEGASRLSPPRRLDGTDGDDARQVGSGAKAGQWINHRPESPRTTWLNIYPVESTESVHLAMQYYIQVYARSISFHLGTFEESFQCLQTIFPHLVHDELWFMTAVAFGLEMRRKAAPKPTPVSMVALEYQKKAYAALRRRLSSSDEDIASDNVLMAVLMLISTCMVQGDVKAADSHINGLRRLVSLRGGVESLETSFNGYLQERVAGHFALWKYTTASLKVDAGRISYPTHPFPPPLCRLLSKLPDGLEELALSGAINLSIIRLMTGVVGYATKITKPPSTVDNSDADNDDNRRQRNQRVIHKLFTWLYALSRHSRMSAGQLSAIEQLLIVSLVEFSIFIGSPSRKLHYVILGFQHSRVTVLLSTLKGWWDVTKQRHTDALIWMGAVFVATGHWDSDSFALGKKLLALQDHEGLAWEERVAAFERYLWTPGLSDRLEKNLSDGK